MMSRGGLRRTIPIILSAALLAGGCLGSRSNYFRDVRRRRVEAYRRWRVQNAEADRPKIEGPLGIDEAVRLALLHNPGLESALHEKDVARGRILEAYSEALPKIDLTGQYRHLDQVMSVDLGVQSFTVGDQDNYSWRVTLTQPLFKGGSIFIAQRAARLFAYLTDEGIRSRIEGVIFEVALAYYDTALAQRLIEVQQAALESARAQLKSVAARERHGVATEYDVLRASVEIAIVQADLLEQKNRRDLSRARLLRKMGVSQQSRVELVTDLSYQPVSLSFEEVVRAAFENRPDIYLAVINADLQRQVRNEAYTDYLPSLEAYYWYLWAKPDPHEASLVEWGTEWQTGLNLTWSLLDGLAREGRIIRQTALLRQKEIQIADTEQQALLEARSALLELENAAEFVESQNQNLARARRALELVEAGYRAEVNTEIEVLDARTAVTRTRGLYYQALYRHTVARIALQKAMGLIGPAPGERGIPKDVSSPGHVEAALPEQQEAAGQTPQEDDTYTD